MQKRLYITEKPDVATKIANAVGGFKKISEGYESSDAIISYAFGHLVSVNAPEEMLARKGIEALPLIPSPFVLEISKEKAQQFKVLRGLMTRADIGQVVNACDAGREGELIFRLIYEAAKCRKPMLRMWPKSMEPNALADAYVDLLPGSQFDNMADAARSRSEADWVVGINISRALTALNAARTGTWKQVTAGRVQTPTLALLVHREREIKGFVPRHYWEVLATFQLNSGGAYQAKWQRSGEAGDEDGKRSQFATVESAEAVVSRCRGRQATRIENVSKDVSSGPPHLYDLTLLQREANSKLGLSAKETLDIAQKLYEAGVTTYPRTDSIVLPEDAIESCRQAMAALASSSWSAEHAKHVLDNAWIVPKKSIFDNSGVTDHSAIVPTGSLPSGLSAIEAKVYGMVVMRFIAVFFPPARSQVTTRSTWIDEDLFRTSGSVLIDAGWKAVYGATTEDDDESAEAGSLCAMQAGEGALAKDVTSRADVTKPPKRYTEATLLEAMANAGKEVDAPEQREALKARGLGTPATRAATIEGLLASRTSGGKAKEPFSERQLIGKKKYLVPTDHGMTTIEFAEKEHVGEITSAELTGDWELRLRLMEAGDTSREGFMADIAAFTTRLVSIIRDKAGQLPPQPGRVSEPLDLACPKCHGSDVLAMDARVVRCGAAGCGFAFWRNVAGVDLDVAALRGLFQGDPFSSDKFFSPTKNKHFAAALKLGPAPDFKATFEFPDTVPTASAPDFEAKCPKCGGATKLRGGTWPAVVCAAECGFKLGRVIAKRELSEGELRRLIQDRALPTVHGYISGKGKAFSAALRLKKDFSGVDFQFEDR